MTADPCRERREDLGAYVLGQLSEPERLATQAHLEGCPACRAEAESLAPLAGLLELADPEYVAGPAPAAPAGLGDRIARRIAAERRAARRRRRFRFGFAFSGATAAVTAATIAIVVALAPSGGSGAQQVAFRNLPPGAQIGATLEPKAWGTEVSMRVSGIRSGTLCRVFLRTNGGRAEPAGSFRYRYSSENQPEVLSTALDMSDVRAIEVRAGRHDFVQPLPQGAAATTSSQRTTNQEETT